MVIQLAVSESERRVQPESLAEGKVDAVFFVMQRANGHWSPGAKVMAVFDKEHEAELHAAHLKGMQPHQHFCVAALRSEARTVENPVEIVRVTPPEVLQ